MIGRQELQWLHFHRKALTETTYCLCLWDLWVGLNWASLVACVIMK